MSTEAKMFCSKEQMYFMWFSNGYSEPNNTEELNALLAEGWRPVREAQPSSPNGERLHSSRLLLILLER